MKIELLENSNESDWNDFIDRYVTKEYAFRLEWKRILDQVFGYESRYYLIKDRSAVIAIFPAFFVKSRLLGNRIISIPFSDMGGVYFSPGLTSQVKLEIFRIVNRKMKKDFSFSRPNQEFPFEIRGGLKDLDDFYTRECLFVKIRPYGKFVINLMRPWVDIEGRFSRNIKRNLSKGEKEIRIEICRDKKLLVEVYDIYIRHIKKMGSLPLPFIFFEKLWDEFYDKDDFLVFLAYRKSQMVGAISLIAHKAVVYADLIMNLPEYDHFFIKICLYRASLKYTWSTKKFKLYDFNRTRYGSGIFEHKSKWGGEEEPIFYYYPTFGQAERCFLDSDNRRFTLMEPLIKYCPAGVLKLLGRKLRREAAK